MKKVPFHHCVQCREYYPDGITDNGFCKLSQTPVRMIDAPCKRALNDPEYFQR